MELTLPFGQQEVQIRLDLPSQNVLVAQSKNPPGGGWCEVVENCLAAPIGATPIRDADLRGKRVVILTDDWGRPTPASEVTPLLLREVKAGGARDEDITFITASGMHDPMSEDELARKLGRDIVANYCCISHDGGDWDNLSFVGISEIGTPVWVNRCVAEADYTVAFGRIYLHIAYGYEGGYKMILPGVAGFDTIVRDHSFNFSADSVEGIHHNPSRAEADAVGEMVGIDFLINVVVNAASRPVRAFCGVPKLVHETGIEYGDREVWGAQIRQPADIVVCSPGSEGEPKKCYDLTSLYRAARVAKEGGTVIYVTAEEAEFEPDKADREATPEMRSLGLNEFQRALGSLAFSEIIRLHERRDWSLSEREIQWRIKALRSEFYQRRRLHLIAKRQVILTPEPNKAVQRAVQRAGDDPRVLVLPEGKTTLPKERLFRAKPVA